MLRFPFVSCVISAAIAFAISGLFVFSTQGQDTPLSSVSVIEPQWLENGRHIYGSFVETEYLKGKVILVEYWGINCPPCLAAMPKLRDLQSQLGSTGVFGIIGSHVQALNDDVDTFLNNTKINFPVYQQLYVPDNRPAGGIPFSVLIDANGCVVAKGHPMEMINKIPPLIEQALVIQRMNSGPIPHPLAGFNLGPFQKQAEMFNPGKAWLGSYRQLKKQSEGGEPLVVQLLQTIDMYIDQQSKRLTELAEAQPAHALIPLQLLSRSIKGMPQEEQISEVLKPIQNDKNAKDLSMILLNIGKFEAQVANNELKPSAVKVKAGSLFKNLKTYSGRKNLDPRLLKEARTAGKNLVEKYSEPAPPQMNNG